MENYEYNNLIINNELEKLSNITRIGDLVEYKYLGRYLIEYLLEKGIHTTIMDSQTKHLTKWIIFYLKYEILKPLLHCYLKPLLETYDKELLLEKVLKKLNNDEKMELYNNLKENSYWEFHDYEDQIINIYAKYGITIPKVFLHKPVVLDSHESLRKSDFELLEEFKKVFSDSNEYTLSIYLHEFKRRLSIDSIRTKKDIKKLINYKKVNKGFTLLISSNTEGEYDSEFNTMTISPHRCGVLTHELSHLMYDRIDEETDNLDEYNKIIKVINNSKTITKIKQYLITFHNNFDYMKKIFEELYYHQIKTKYGNYNEYIKVVCDDILKHHPDIIATESGFYFYIDDSNIVDVVSELLLIEKEEFININTRNYYHEELMLENFLDAILKGKLFDGKLGIRCLSGHLGRDFAKHKDLSFDECLADYDAIRNSVKSNQLIIILRTLVGDELLNLLDNYLTKNRGCKYGK